MSQSRPSCFVSSACSVLLPSAFKSAARELERSRWNSSARRNDASWGVSSGTASSVVIYARLGWRLRESEKGATETFLAFVRLHRFDKHICNDRDTTMMLPINYLPYPIAKSVSLDASMSNVCAAR